MRFWYFWAGHLARLPYFPIRKKKPRKSTTNTNENVGAEINGLARSFEVELMGIGNLIFWIEFCKRFFIFGTANRFLTLLLFGWLISTNGIYCDNNEGWETEHVLVHFMWLANVSPGQYGFGFELTIGITDCAHIINNIEFKKNALVQCFVLVTKICIFPSINPIDLWRRHKLHNSSILWKCMPLLFSLNKLTKKINKRKFKNSLQYFEIVFNKLQWNRRR